ncbi:hypothetical protein ACQ4N7_24255 [Nodosilinea sp. AN01ver1]|uniref:hypothetical protein n=1 Tax=Nodosilinea sp. AN01ver1 TaxID=3423362 RepID=UPI003D31FB25
MGVLNPAQATAAQRVAGEPSTAPASLARYTVVEDTESWSTVLYGDRDFAKLGEFVNSSLQRERTDELSSAYLNRLYNNLANLPAHSDRTYTEADEQQLAESLAVVDKWIAKFPNSHIPYVVRGNLHFKHGWQIRGNSIAARVPNDAWPPFLQSMELAKADLEKAAALNPNDPNVWSSLLNVARGLSLPESVWQGYYERGIAANPYHIDIWGTKSVLLEAKWQGDEARLLQLAQECDRLAKAANKPLLGLVPIGIYRGVAKVHEGFLTQPGVWGEMEASYSRIFAAYPDNLRARFYYTYDASLAQRADRAAEQFEIIGDRWTNSNPWPSLKTYHEARATTLQMLSTDAYNQADYLQAEHLALKSLDLLPMASTYLMLAGIQGQHYRDMPRAVEYAQQALTVNPSPEERLYAEEIIARAEAYMKP